MQAEDAHNIDPGLDGTSLAGQRHILQILLNMPKASIIAIDPWRKERCNVTPPQM